MRLRWRAGYKRQSPSGAAITCWEDQVNTDFIAGLIVGVSIGLMLLWLLRRRRPPNA